MQWGIPGLPHDGISFTLASFQSLRNYEGLTVLTVPSKELQNAEERPKGMFAVG